MRHDPAIRRFGLALAVLAAVFMASGGAIALAAEGDLLYVPEEAFVTVPAGSYAQVEMGVTKASVTSSQMVRFLGSVEGDVPSSWISSSSYYQFISISMPTVTTTLTVSVPEGTAPGVYAGRVYSWGGFRPTGVGAGMYLEVTVPAECESGPDITITGLGPSVIWPPNHGMVEVLAEGYVENPEGCGLSEIGYFVDDEYGEYTGYGAIGLDAEGNFSVPIPVEASRTGRDKDGRRYFIILYAANEAGEVTLGPFEVLVPHDMRDKDR